MSRPDPSLQTLIADTLAMMRLIERTDELADCHLWRGSTSASGHPTYKPEGQPCTLVRRAMYQLAGGQLQHRVPIAVSCDERLCINPAHLHASSFSKIAKKAAARGAWRTRARAAKIANTKRASPGAKLTIELAREIRLSSESGPLLAARHGVHRAVIAGIKAGTRWRDYSNPFAGLMV